MDKKKQVIWVLFSIFNSKVIYTAWKHIDREPFGELKVIRANAKQNS